MWGVVCGACASGGAISDGGNGHEADLAAGGDGVTTKRKRRRRARRRANETELDELLVGDEVGGCMHDELFCYDADCWMCTGCFDKEVDAFMAKYSWLDDEGFEADSILAPCSRSNVGGGSSGAIPSGPRTSGPSTSGVGTCGDGASGGETCPIPAEGLALLGLASFCG